MSGRPGRARWGTIVAMQTDVLDAPPRVIPPLVSALRADLLAAPYTIAATEDLYGPLAVAALRRENPVPARRVLRGRTDPLAVLLSVLTLGAAVPRPLIDAALPSLGAEGALELGILVPASDGEGGADADAADGESLLRAAIDLSPYSAQDDAGEIDWWIASDLSELATGRPLRGEHVLGVGGASLTLARITPRDAVGSVLDLGCGGGIQALHAARHARRVVATDLSERALAVAAFNAALNAEEGAAPIELRHGSLLEPVAGETFDLVVSNPPFVITPRDTALAHDRTAGAEGSWTYRDGGRAGDTLLAELLGALPSHLAPGGRAVMLGNWEVPDGEATDAHPRAWLDPALEDGVDAWVILRETEDPAQYAETWGRDGGVTDRDPRWQDMQDAWLDDFAARGVEGLGFGYLLLRRPERGTAPRPGILRSEEATGTGSGTLSSHLTASLAMIDVLAGIDDDALAASRPVRAADVVERRHLTPGAWDPTLIELVQGAGLARAVCADQLLAATVGALDGTLTLGQTVSAVCALTDTDPDQARETLFPQIRELVTTGMLSL